MNLRHSVDGLMQLCVKLICAIWPHTEVASESPTGNGGGRGFRSRGFVFGPTQNYFVLLRTKSFDTEPLHSESQHSFLPCSHRHLFHPRLQAAARLSFNSRARRLAPFDPCAI